MTRRQPLQVLQRTTEHDSGQLRPQLAQLDTALARCEQDLAAARLQLADSLRNAGSTVREGAQLAPGAMLMWRDHARTLQARQLVLEQQRAQLTAWRDEVVQALTAAALTLKAIDLHHRQIDQRLRRAQAQRHQATVDELWAARHVWREDLA